MKSKYTLEYLIELSHQAVSIKDFRNKFPSAHVRVYTQGWSKEVFGKYGKERIYRDEFATSDKILKEIITLQKNKTITTSNDLKNKFPHLYHWYYQLNLHKTHRVFNGKKTYSFNTCKKIAKKYKSKKEFTLFNYKVYTFAYRRGWLKKICIHMKGKRDNFRENFCRKIFQVELKRRFPSSRPEWLINPLTGYRLELDGYCKSLNLAFEYNGRIHYDKSHPNFEATRRRDKIKRQICRRMKIKLITINAYSLEKIKAMTLRKIKAYQDKISINNK